MLRRRFLVALGLTPLAAGAVAAAAHDAVRKADEPDMVEVEYLPVQLANMDDPFWPTQHARRVTYPLREAKAVHRYRLLKPADQGEPATIAALILYEGPNSPRLAHLSGYLQRI